jgi:hypothetical protein
LNTYNVANPFKHKGKRLTRFFRALIEEFDLDEATASQLFKDQGISFHTPNFRTDFLPLSLKLEKPSH